MFQDYGTMSGYSTLRSGPGPATRDQENLDYETLSRSGIVSEEELEKWVHTGSFGVVMLHTICPGRRVRGRGVTGAGS